MLMVSVHNSGLYNKTIIMVDLLISHVHCLFFDKKSMFYIGSIVHGGASYVTM